MQLHQKLLILNQVLIDEQTNLVSGQQLFSHAINIH